MASNPWLILSGVALFQKKVDKSYLAWAMIQAGSIAKCEAKQTQRLLKSK